MTWLLVAWLIAATNLSLCVQLAVAVSDIPSIDIPGGTVSSGNIRRMRTLVVATGDFTSGRDDQAVFDQIVSVLDSANKYLLPLRLKVELAGVQSFQPGSEDPYAAATFARDATKMLEAARADLKTRGSVAHDLVIVLARSSFRANYGASYPFTMCFHPNLLMVFATQAGSGLVSEQSLGATVAHEIGHSVGIDHDSAFYADGPSLMWSSFAPNVNRFSQRSLKEFAAFEAAGGTACLEELLQALDTTALSAASSFELVGGTKQKFLLQEGVTFKHRFSVGGYFPGATFEVLNLPAGASFDTLSGELNFTPSYATVLGRKRNVKLKLVVRARNFDSDVEAQVELKVERSNRTPEFVQSLEAALYHGGDVISLEVLADDPDSGDKAKLKLLNKKEIRRYPGSPKVAVKRNRAVLRWAIPVGVKGDFSFQFQARDGGGARSLKTITLHVE